MSVNVFIVKDSQGIEEARRLGYDVLEDENIMINEEAVRMIPENERALGVEISGDVLQVLVDRLLSPGELKRLEQVSKALITIIVTTEDILTNLLKKIRESAQAEVESHGLAEVLNHSINLNASDVHISIGSKPKMRVAGDLQEFKEFNVVSSEDVEGYVKWIVGDTFSSLGTDTDTSFTFQGFRWRVNIYKQRYGFALALRKIPVSIPDIDGLDLPKSVVKLANLTQGLIMFCGPTGHGKSTSLAALIDRINQTRKCHILTIEDPIEYVHNDKVAIVHQREIGEDTPNFATALRSALREDIDVLLVGEMRDLETIQMAISAAETGHLVLGTIHSTDTIGVFRRIIDSFPPGQQDQIRTQLSATVKAVVAQFLLPSTSQGKRQLVCEVLTTNTAVKNIVRDNRLHELGSLLQTSAGEGMVSFDKSLARHVASGRISPKIAEEWVRDKKTYMDYLSNLKLDHIAKDGDNLNDTVWG